MCHRTKVRIILFGIVFGSDPLSNESPFDDGDLSGTTRSIRSWFRYRCMVDTRHRCPYHVIIRSRSVASFDLMKRRDALRSAGLLGLGIHDLWLRTLQAQTQSTAKPSRTAPSSTRSCVFIFLFGGQSHLDLWDMKPDAPVEVRGEFQPISSNVPGIQITVALQDKHNHPFAILAAPSKKLQTAAREHQHIAARFLTK